MDTVTDILGINTDILISGARIDGQAVDVRGPVLEVAERTTDPRGGTRGCGGAGERP